jgi:hypothetical protein
MAGSSPYSAAGRDGRRGVFHRLSMHAGENDGKRVTVLYRGRGVGTAIKAIASVRMIGRPAAIQSEANGECVNS